MILTSAVPGRFSAGLDLELILGQVGQKVRALLDKLYVELADVQFNLGKPSIAAVNGAARGGGMTLAISCDVLLAASSATFGYPEIDLGLVAGDPFRPPAAHRRAPPRLRAVVLRPRVRRRGGRIARAGQPGGCRRGAARGGARAGGAASHASRRPACGSPALAFMRANDHRAGIADAVEVFCNAAVTETAQEGLRAFLEKRAPKW